MDKTEGEQKRERLEENQDGRMPWQAGDECLLKREKMLDTPVPVTGCFSSTSPTPPSLGT